MKKPSLYILISLVVSFLFVTIYTYGATTISTNIDTGGTLSVTGDATFDTDTLYVDSTNDRVGVGTTSPFANLSINHSAGETAFAIGSSTATSFIVDSSGNVGIGTTGPEGKLEIKHTSATRDDPQIAIEGSGGQEDDFAIWAESGVNKLNIGFNSTTAYQGTVITFDVGTAGLFSGNVGIGTTSPWSLLSIHSKTNSIFKSTLFAVASSSPIATTTHFVVNADGNVGIGTTSPTGLFSIEQGSTGPVMFVGDQGTSTPHFVIDGQGRVGIGTSSPGAMLGVGNATAATTTIDFSKACFRMDVDVGGTMTQIYYSPCLTNCPQGAAGWATSTTSCF